MRARRRGTVPSKSRISVAHMSTGRPRALGASISGQWRTTPIAVVPPERQHGRWQQFGPTRDGSCEQSQSRVQRFGPGSVAVAVLVQLPRKLSLVFLVLAVGALVIGGGFAEISSNGSPTALETAIVRYVIVGSLVLAAVAYVVGGRMRADQRG